MTDWEPEHCAGPVSSTREKVLGSCPAGAFAESPEKGGKGQLLGIMLGGLGASRKCELSGGAKDGRPGQGSWAHSGASGGRRWPCCGYRPG